MNLANFIQNFWFSRINSTKNNLKSLGNFLENLRMFEEILRLY